MRYVLVFVGGLMVFLAAFTKRGRSRPHWSRIALWMIGFAVIVWSLLGVVLTRELTSLSPIGRDLLYTVKKMLSGLALGQLLLLIFARGFSDSSSRAKAQGESEPEKGGRD